MFFDDFHSFVLAHVFGLYLIIMAIIMLARVGYYREMIRNLQPASGSVVFGAMYGLLLGLLLVTIHNHWEWRPSVIVTFLAWLILIKSILWLAFPETMLRFAKKTYAGKGYYVAIAIAAILGMLLISKGAYPFIHWDVRL